MLSSLEFPIVVFVAESNGCFKQPLLKWAQKSHHIRSAQVAVCIFLAQQAWSHFQNTQNKFIFEPHFMNFFEKK